FRWVLLIVRFALDSQYYWNLFDCRTIKFNGIDSESFALCFDFDFHFCGSFYQIGSISVSLLVAWSHGCAYARFGLSAFGYYGKSRNLYFGKIYTCLKRWIYLE